MSTTNLSTRCDEILAWRKTGIYEGTELQKLADQIEASGRPIPLSPIRAAEEETIKEVLSLIADITTRRPHFSGITTAEPDLADIVFGYYQPHFGTSKATMMTALYFTELMDPKHG
ncbi:hypothetical protein LAV_00176 [Sphingobium phage Lacusarx]|uniref:Uncharacterized protein n=1 Tax=Sphingobium phage Lacusarx TaxID=1980139 RepID=A0A1W6DXC9_9CAUD|nr:hypothetical protein FDH44_gp127 [Sphingobium phage Lacusarx]ARK07551.1 hypothetical protein LAV_00176 [Sphingobium phage Lacusarx]